MSDTETTEVVLDQLAEAGGGGDAEEMLAAFVDRTPMLTPSERVALLADALDAGEINFGRTGRDIQSWGQFGAGLVNLAGSIAGAFGGRDGRQAQRILQGIGAVGGTLANFTGAAFQQFGRPRQGSVPPIRPGTQQGARGRAPVRQQQRGRAPVRQQQRGRAPAQGQMPGRGQMPARGQMVSRMAVPQRAPAPAGQPGRAPLGGGVMNANMIAMLQQMLRNRQARGGLARGVVRPAASEVTLEIADGQGGTEPVSIPLGAVANAIAVVASEAMNELNAHTDESDPEIPDYLIGHGGELIVDPSRPEERAALVVHYFRLAAEAEREGLRGRVDGMENFEGAYDDDDFV